MSYWSDLTKKNIGEGIEAQSFSAVGPILLAVGWNKKPAQKACVAVSFLSLTLNGYLPNLLESTLLPQFFVF
jgi:hypothetical protein